MGEGLCRSTISMVNKVSRYHPARCMSTSQFVCNIVTVHNWHCTKQFTKKRTSATQHKCLYKKTQCSYMPKKGELIRFTYQHYQRYRSIYLIPINIRLPSRVSTLPKYCQLSNYFFNDTASAALIRLRC